MSFLSDYLGPLFLLSVGLSAVIGGWSAYQKANRLFARCDLQEPEKEQQAALAKAFIAAGFAGLVWYDSAALDEAIIRVAIPLGVYKFVQLLLTPVIGSQLNAPVETQEKAKFDNG